MPTTKKRINITVSDELDSALEFLSKSDDVSKSTKAVQLIKIALELDEDGVWDSLASRRDTKKAKFVTHENAWK